MRIKNQVLRFVLKLLVLLPFGLVFATVFALSDELALGVISAKSFWFYGAMGICGVTTTTYLALRKQFKIRFTLAELLLLLFTVLGLLPFLTGAEAIHTKALELMLLAVLYLYYRMVLRAYPFSRYFLTLVLLFTALGQAVWGMAQLYGYLPSQHHLFTLTGSFFNPGPYAGYLAMLSPLAWYYVLWDYRVWKLPFTMKVSLFYLRWLVAALALLAIVLVLPASMSRAAWLASAFGCSMVGIAFLSKTYKLKTYLLRNKKLIPVALILLALLVSGGSFALYRLKKDSADGRALIWKNTLNAIKEQPLGVGLGHFAGAYGKAQAAYFETGRASEQEQTVAGNPEYAFNEYLQIGLEVGVAGLLLLIAAVTLLIKKGIEQQQYGTVGAVLALLVFAAMSYPFSVLPFLIVFVYLLAQLADLHKTASQTQAKSTLVPIIIILIFNLGVLTFCLHNRYPTYKAYKNWNNTKMLFSMQQYTDATPEYAQIAPYLSDRVEFLFEYGQALSKTAHYQKSNELLMMGTSLSCDPMLYNIMGKNHQALKNCKAAERSYRMAANIVPNRIYPSYLLAKLYIETANKHEFEQAASLVLQKEPKIHSPAIEEMRKEIKELKRTTQQIE